MERSLPLLKESVHNLDNHDFIKQTLHTGVMFDCHRGIYIGEEVQSLANKLGWKYSSQFEMVMKDDDTVDAEAYIWAWDEAEDWLNENLAKDDHYFGSASMAGCGCWGYWLNEYWGEDVNV